MAYSYDYNYDFIEACSIGDLGKLTRFAWQRSSKRGLTIATRNGHLHIIKYLVQYHNADIHCPVNNMLTIASTFGHFEIVEYIIDNGVNIHLHKYNALLCASYYGHIDIARYLIEKGANVSDSNALKWACEKNNLDMVKLLVEVGHSPISQECLLISSRDGYSDIVNYFVIIKNTPIGSQHIFWASAGGHFEIARFLLSKSKNVHVEISTDCRKYIKIYSKGRKSLYKKSARRIYFWWIKKCYDVLQLTGQRSMIKNYNEYVSMCTYSLK